ncbi:zinc finger B-box domain-containing protein 1 isoform X2 [Oxyura jamaicensis]|uniref:zinc finger B-box domain-containing protein 1 isoform X2 n=1 Tax=Oxyura jamaicensis TaxID=8884 RepID=UPI0015A66A09|nr:zinc finger B-box domain-containing protein 1 isoform X2 [Oxyura jamaicensis]
MNSNGFVILPGSKSGTSVRLKAKTVRELRLEKVQLEMENKEMEKKLRQLQSNMSREKEERKKSSAYHWKSGQAGPMTIQARLLSQSKEKNNKVSSGKVKLQILKDQMKEPVKEPFKHEMSNSVPHEKSEVKELACGQCETKSALLTEANMHFGNLEVVHHFTNEGNLNESKINHEEKKVNCKHQVTSNKFSSLPVSVSSAEELFSESAWTGLDDQDKGLLLNGTFNEEESAKCFQDALIQWRNGSCDHRKEQHAGEVLSESVGICEVQTNLTTVKESVQIQFKDGGLSYMEKLLLKKYRRTAVDEISGSCIKDLRPMQTQAVSHQAVTGGGEKGDDDSDVNDLTVEEVKRYWTSVFREQVPETAPETAEPTLKIEFLDDSYCTGLEESCNFLVTEAGAIEMNNQRKTEALKEFESFPAVAGQNNTVLDLLLEETVGTMRKSSSHLSATADTPYLLHLPLDRNPVSSKEILQEKMFVCSVLERNAEQKDTIELKTVGRSLSSCKLPEKTSDPSELMSNNYLFEIQLQKNDKDSQELDGDCNSQSLVMPIITTSSADVARIQKSASTKYRGLEGFFVVGVNPKQVMLEASSSLCADSSPTNRSIPFPGHKKWYADRSLSEYADDSVVQGVIESQLNRPSSGLETQNRISPLMVVCRSYSGNDSQRPQSADMLQHNLTRNRPKSIQPRPKSSPVHTFRVDTEIPKHECTDVTKQDEDHWKYIADQEALLTLEKELQSYASSQEKLYSLISEDVTSSSIYLRKIHGNVTNFHKNLELKDHNRDDMSGGCDEGQMDDKEEILEDKRQVLALK